MEVVETNLEAAGGRYREANPEVSLRVIHSEPETNWHKLDHLVYLPILGLTRPRDLYYYQGEGLKVLYGFTYKYLTLEHFLGQLTRLQIGYPLADAWARCYSQAWYPGDDPLFIFTDWHVKPHWTKHPAHSGHVAMWGQVMPGTKQLLINGPDGHLLGGWNYPVDTHLTHVLVDLEAHLATNLERPIAYNVFDSEGSGLPTAERYAEARRAYISVLPRKGDQSLAVFEASYSYVTDTPDFFRRPLQHYPMHGGRFTGEPAYFQHLLTAAQTIMEEMALTAKDLDYAIFHQPNAKFPQRAAKILGFSREQIAPGLLVSRIGNAYAGSSLLGLTATLDVAQPGQRILFASFGSGAGSDAFVLTVAEGIEEKKGRAPRTEEYVGRRQEIDYGTYVRYRKKLHMH